MTRPVMGTLRLSGIVRDIAAAEVAADKWTAGRNVFFKAGRTFRTPGEAPFGETGRLFEAKFCHYVDLGAQSWWIYGGDDGVAVTNGTDHHDITPAGWLPIATKNRIYTVGDLHSLPFVNHPEVGPFWWDGQVTEVMQPLPDWPVNQVCRVMRAHKNFLFAIDVDTGSGLQEGMAQWSSSANPGEVPEFWTPAPDNDAGDFHFGQPGGPLIGGIGVRDQFFLMKANATYAGQYVGGQWVFQARDIFPSKGLMAPNACVEDGNLVYMLTGEGEVIRHDGNSYANLLYGVMQDELNRQINWEYPSSVFLYRDGIDGQIVIAYPTGTSVACTEAITIEIATGDLGIRDLPRVYGVGQGLVDIELTDWDSDDQAWDDDLTTWNESASGYLPAQIVFAGGDQGMLEQGASEDQWGADQSPLPMAAWVQRLALDLEEYDYRKTMTGLVPIVHGVAGNVISGRFGVQQGMLLPVEWLPQQEFVIGEDERFDFFIDGRFLSFEFSSVGGQVWQIGGARPLARKSGRW